MLYDFYVTFMFNFSNPPYNNSKKTSDFWTKLFPAIIFNEEEFEVAPVDCVFKIHLIFCKKSVHTRFDYE